MVTHGATAHSADAGVRRRGRFAWSCRRQPASQRRSLPSAARSARACLPSTRTAPRRAAWACVASAAAPSARSMASARACVVSRSSHGSAWHTGNSFPSDAFGADTGWSGFGRRGSSSCRSGEADLSGGFRPHVGHTARYRRHPKPDIRSALSQMERGQLLSVRF
jgi:hypothetical protein